MINGRSYFKPLKVLAIFRCARLCRLWPHSLHCQFLYLTLARPESKRRCSLHGACTHRLLLSGAEDLSFTEPRSKYSSGLHTYTLAGTHLLILTLDTPASMSTSIDYGSLSGIHSEAAAIVLAIAYAPLLVWFIRQSIKQPTYVHIVLALFCASTFFAPRPLTK